MLKSISNTKTKTHDHRKCRNLKLIVGIELHVISYIRIPKMSLCSARESHRTNIAVTRNIRRPICRVSVQMFLTVLIDTLDQLLTEYVKTHNSFFNHLFN